MLTEQSAVAQPIATDEASLLHVHNGVSAEDWQPGLDIEDLTLGQVLDSLPGFGPDDVDSVVRLFENPESRYAFPGAVNLKRHDCIHVLLGRGLLGQDEAFVVGYTMGSVHDRLTKDQLNTFRLIAQTVYPDGYRMTDADVMVFDLAYNYGRQAKVPVCDIPYEDRLSETVGALRGEAGITGADLAALFRVEQLLVPGTTVSDRLPAAA
ncbi:MAG: hypothetical protein ACFB6R_04485 [Alphaproteobacteria bacterium]